MTIKNLGEVYISGNESSMFKAINPSGTRTGRVFGDLFASSSHFLVCSRGNHVMLFINCLPRRASISCITSCHGCCLLLETQRAKGNDSSVGGPTVERFE